MLWETVDTVQMEHITAFVSGELKYAHAPLTAEEEFKLLEQINAERRERGELE